MPRKYKPEPGSKQYKKYDPNVIQEAVDEYLTGNSSLKTIAAKYNIHLSVLYRHSKGQLKCQGGQRALSIDTENYIIEYINVCADWGYPLDSLDLRYIIKMYLDKLGITHKRFKNNLPGPDFFHGFLNRHKEKISQRICQNIKRSRAAVSAAVIKKYFEELEKSLADVPPSNIVNYDETNLADDPGRRKVLTKRGTKYPERVMNHSKASISIMMAGSADGQLLPPYVVYKAQNLYNTWTTNGPKGARYNRTSSGWFDGVIFQDWVQSILIPFFADKPGKKVLIGDNLSSHLSVELIKLCKEENINFVFLPSNSTHLTQPLDVAFFRPMKTAWRQILLKWKKSDGSNETSVPKGCFPKLLKNLMEIIQDNAASNLKAGFKKTGIYPLDPTQVLSRLPDEVTDTERYKDAVDKSVLNLLSEMRYGTMGIKENTRKRKLNVVAGQSVSASTEEDYVESEPTAGPSTSSRKQKRNVVTRPRESASNAEVCVDSEPTAGPSTSKKLQRTLINTEKENLSIQDTIKLQSKVTKKGKGVGKRTKIMKIISTYKDNSMNTNSDITTKLNVTETRNINIETQKSDNSYQQKNIEDDINVDDEIKVGSDISEDCESSFLNMPVYFEDDLVYDKELIIENYLPEISMGSSDKTNFIQNDHSTDRKQEKINIIENLNFFETKENISDIRNYKNISPTAPISILKKNSKPKNYYKDDEAILKVLLDENV
ncbi:uncharacterized protein LOC132902258 [Amyelois transitella]|uniref:uncharacterized protein LOC132902258 n=1 Tax=Amyelois transitella TaxID=680683 RepID=UPI00298F61C9|nr:uncharacterized protein LOC132902258 [Amyelois transitella]